jgi:hypothetical protein
MKKKLMLFGLVFFLGGSVLFAQSRSVTILNNTGYTIYHVYVSPSNVRSWQEDLLGANQIFLNGYEIDVDLPRGGQWDIMLEDEDGDTYTKYRISAGSRINFTISDLD